MYQEDITTFLWYRPSRTSLLESSSKVFRRREEIRHFHLRTPLYSMSGTGTDRKTEHWFLYADINSALNSILGSVIGHAPSVPEQRKTTGISIILQHVSASEVQARTSSHMLASLVATLSPFRSPTRISAVRWIGPQ